ncbi:MAG TPA: NYN domain-containing protein [Aggregatilineales bacterium]|nr:NYN domain-containing protein [Anaerolineales bacterium]HRE49666.1 NYN domain-containing protein [Aggregatilineales bacterium]
MSAYLIVDVDDLLTRLQQRAFSIDLHELATRLRSSAALAAGLPNPDALRAIAVANWSSDANLAAEQIFYAVGFEIFDVSESTLIADNLILQYFKLDPKAVDELIIVGTHPTLLSLHERVKMSRHARVRVWADSVPESDDYIFQPLESVLGISSKTVALYIDFENISISLHEQGYVVNLDKVIEGFSQHAQAHGQIVRMAAFAPWGQRGSLPPLMDNTMREITDEAPSRLAMANIDPVFNLPGKNSADMRIAKDVLAFGAQADSADVFIIASGDRDFNEVFSALRGRNKQVIVWGVRGSTSRQLENNPALQMEFLDDFLGLQRYPQVGQQMIAAAAGTTTTVTPFTPSQWSTLILQYDRLAVQNSTPDGVPLTLMQEHLRNVSAVVNVQRGIDLITQAVAMGIFRLVRQGGVDYVKPLDEHTIVDRTRLIRDRVMLRVANTLDVRGWEYVNYGFLLKGLAMDRDIEKPGLNTDDAWRSEWVDFLVREGLLARELVPHRHNPDDLVPVIRLTDEIPVLTDSLKMNSAALPVSYDDLDAGTSLHVMRDAETNAMMKRVVISVDQFTSYRNFSWCPLGSLHRRLRPYDSGITFQRAVEWLLELGAVKVDEYDNPQSSYRTKGISLNYKSPIVIDALRERDNFIRTLLKLYEMRQPISIAVVSSHVTFPDNGLGLWMSIMEGENVLNPVPGKPGVFSLFRTHHTVNLVAENRTHEGGHTFAPFEFDPTQDSLEDLEE